MAHFFTNTHIPKKKKKMRNKANRVFTIDFGKINKALGLSIVFIISLIVGLFNHTDIYDRLNELPEDRNELTPIKEMKIEVSDKILVKISYDAISALTGQNFLNNIHAVLTNDLVWMNISFTESSIHIQKKGYFEFGYTDNQFIGNTSIQLFLFNQPINEKKFFNLIPKTNAQFEKTVFSQDTLYKVCLSKKELLYFSPFNILIPKIRLPFINQKLNYKTFYDNPPGAKHVEKKAYMKIITIKGSPSFKFELYDDSQKYEPDKLTCFDELVIL